MSPGSGRWAGIARGNVMSAWTVVVWAVVTPDLEEALQADLAEAAAALGAKRSDPDIHVHVNIVRPRTDGPPSDRAVVDPGG